MAKEFLKEAQVQEEIERLKASPMVKLARKEQHIKYKHRQVLYQLRNLEKRGIQLAQMGITIENINNVLIKQLTIDEVEGVC